MASAPNTKRGSRKVPTPFGGSQRNATKNKKIFISWSGEYTRKFAEKLKIALEENAFKEYDLECFVSSEDISVGSNWRNYLNTELQACGMGIVCITEANLRAPWLYMEAGAMQARGIKTIPLLLNCDRSELDHNPLGSNQSIEFDSPKGFKKLLRDINKEMGIGCEEEIIDARYKNIHAALKKDLHSVLAKLKESHVITEKQIYPQKIDAYNFNTVFVSVPMASIGSEEYELLRESMEGVRDALLKIGFKEVICQMLDIKTQNEFDGKPKAIDKSFKQMKQVECMVAIYPRTIPSSVLVEMGYGIALCKKIVVFHKEKLPFVMQGATGVIPHVRTYEYTDFEDISRMIIDNEMHLFSGKV